MHAVAIATMQRLERGELGEVERAWGKGPGGSVEAKLSETEKRDINILRLESHLWMHISRFYSSYITRNLN